MEPNQLAIAPYLAGIVQTANINAVSIVKGPPGIGKSLGIPYIFSRFKKRIYVTQTRGNSVISLANSQKMINPDYKVGYGKESDLTYQKDLTIPQIAYVTAGHLLGRVLRNISKGDKNPLSFIDILQIDDPDSVEDEVLISLWRYLFNLNVTTGLGLKLPRLLLTSATINPEFYPEIANTIINLTSNSVDDIYHTRSYDVDSNQLYNDMADEVAQFHMGSREGHFLVFCSGKDKIDLVIKRLTEKQLPNVQILPAYARLGTAEINNIYKDVPKNVRKIIVSTNMAETAITIKDLGGVFDCMSVKQMYATPNGGSRLKIVYESHQNALQRRGRTGRNIAGFYYPMMTQSDFEQLDPIPEPILDRAPLHKITMELLSAGLDPVKVVEGYEQSRFDETLQLLISLGAINKDNGKYNVTKLGRFVASSPLSVRNSTFIYRVYEQYLISKDNKMLGANIVIANIIDSYGPPLTWYPPPRKDETPADYQQRVYHHKQHFYQKYVGISDLEVYLKIWADYVNSNGKNRRINVYDSTYIKEWCRQHSINNKKLTEIVKLNRRVNRLLTALIGNSNVKNIELKIDWRIDINNVEQYINVAQPLLEKVYIDRIMRYSPPKNKDISDSTPLFYTHYGEKASYFLALNQSVSEIAKLQPQYIVSLADIIQRKPNKVVRIISLAIPAQQSAEQVAITKITDIQDMLLTTEKSVVMPITVNSVSLPKINTNINTIPKVELSYDKAGHQDIVKPIMINYENSAIHELISDIVPNLPVASTNVTVSQVEYNINKSESILSLPEPPQTVSTTRIIKIKTPPRINIKVKPSGFSVPTIPNVNTTSMIGSSINISDPVQNIKVIPQFSASPATCPSGSVSDQPIITDTDQPKIKVTVSSMAELKAQLQKTKSITSTSLLEELKPSLQVSKPTDRLAGQSIKISTTSIEPSKDIVEDFLSLDI